MHTAVVTHMHGATTHVCCGTHVHHIAMGRTCIVVPACCGAPTPFQVWPGALGRGHLGGAQPFFLLWRWSAPHSWMVHTRLMALQPCELRSCLLNPTPCDNALHHLMYPWMECPAAPQRIALTPMGLTLRACGVHASGRLDTSPQCHSHRARLRWH